MIWFDLSIEINFFLEGGILIKLQDLREAH